MKILLACFRRIFALWQYFTRAMFDQRVNCFCHEYYTVLILLLKL